MSEQHALAEREEDLRAAVRRGEGVVEAARAVMAEHRPYRDWSAKRELWYWNPAYDYAGAALLAGEGPAVAAAVWRILHEIRDDGAAERLLADLSEAEYSEADRIGVAWLRILAGDWRPLPGVRTSAGSFDLTAALLAAVASSDRAAIEAAIAALEARDPSPRPSVLAAALRGALLEG